MQVYLNGFFAIYWLMMISKMAKRLIILQHKTISKIHQSHGK